jgi:hypothetical protein
MNIRHCPLKERILPERGTGKEEGVQGCGSRKAENGKEGQEKKDRNQDERPSGTAVQRR